MPLTSGAPLKLKDTADFQRMQDSSNGDLNYLAFRAGEEIASTATSTTRGMLQTTTASRYVGLYVDTFLDSAVGTYPAQATSQIALTTLYQNFGSDSNGSLGPDIARRPVRTADSDGQMVIREISPSSQEANELRDRLTSILHTNEYPGSFKLASTNPNSNNYDVWESNAFVDTRTSGNINYSLFLKTSDSAGARPDQVLPFAIKRSDTLFDSDATPSADPNDFYGYANPAGSGVVTEAADDATVPTALTHGFKQYASDGVTPAGGYGNSFGIYWDGTLFGNAVGVDSSGWDRPFDEFTYFIDADSAGANFAEYTLGNGNILKYFSIRRTLTTPRPKFLGLQLMDSDQVGKNFALEVLNVMGGTNDGDYDANIGQYLLLSNTSGEPNGLGYSGTWSARGVASNTKHTVSTANYTRSRESNFSSAYTTDYTGTFTRNRVSTFTRTRTSSFTADSTTTDVESRTSTFVLGFLGNYLNEFTRNVDTSSESPFTRQTNYGSDTFTTEYVGPDFQGDYVKETSYTGTYSGDQAVNFVSTADGGGLFGYAGGEYVSGGGGYISNFINTQNLQDYIDNFAGLANPYTDTYVNTRTQYIEAPYIFEDYIYDTLSTNQIDATDQTGELRGIDLTMFNQPGGTSGGGTSYTGAVGYANNYMTSDQYSGVTINYIGNYSGTGSSVNYLQGYVSSEIITIDAFLKVTYPFGSYGPSQNNYYIGAETGAYLGPEEDGLTAVMLQPADNGEPNFWNVTAFRHNRIIFAARNVFRQTSESFKFRGSDGKVYTDGDFIDSYPSMIHWVRYIIGITDYTQLQGIWYELKEVNVVDQAESFTGNVNYVGNYIHNAQIGYTTEYQGTDTFIGNFTGFIVESYQADYQRTTEDQYTTAYEGNYTGDFVNEFLADFQNVYTTNYVGDFGGTYTGTSTYTGDFTSNFQGDFLETSYAYYPYNFIAGAEYTGSNTEISSISDENNMIIINYSPYNPGGTGGTWYMRIIVGGSEIYTGPTGGSSLNDDHFAYPVTVGGYKYQRYPNNNQSWQSGTGYFYFRWARWSTSNAGEGLFGAYTGGYQTNYQRTDTAEIGYTGAFLSDKNVDYATDYLNYSAPYVTNYERVSTRTTEVSYAGGSDAYVNYSAPYIGEYIGNFVGDFSLEFTGDYANYVTPYTGNFEGAFANEYLTDYQQEYTGDFEGKTIDASTEGVETYTLYVRTE